MSDTGHHTPSGAPGSETLEVYAFLACLGPAAFEPAAARRLVCPGDADPVRTAAIDWLTAPECREDVSREVGRHLADVLSHRARVSSLDLGEILPAMLEVDLARGYQVLRELAAAAPPALAPPLGDILLNLALAARRDADAGTQPDARLACLVEALAALPLESGERTRLFLALSQTLRGPEALRRVSLSALYPARPRDLVQVLAEGNDDALRVLLNGALLRDGGRDAFKAACWAALELEGGQGLGLLARLDPLLRGPEAGLRVLESTVRAAVLGHVERALERGRGVQDRMPRDPDDRTLRLLSLVAPGLREPGRTQFCAWMLDRAAERIVQVDRPEPPGEALVEAIVGAATMHEDPPAAGALVRQALLQAASALRLRVLAVGSPSPADQGRARAFERFAGLLGNDFRRRRPLVGVLEGILPHVTDLSRVPTGEMPTGEYPLPWGDEPAPAP